MSCESSEDSTLRTQDSGLCAWLLLCAALLVAAGCNQTRPEGQAGNSRRTATLNAGLERDIRDLSSPQSVVRKIAIQRIQRLGPGASPALAPLLNTLKDEDDGVCAEGVFTLAGLGPGAAAAVVPAFVDAATAGSIGAQCYDMMQTQIARMGPGAIPILADRLARTPRDSAVEDLLARFGSEAVPPLRAVLEEGGQRAEAAVEVYYRLGTGGNGQDVAAAMPDVLRAYREKRIGEASFVSLVSALGPLADSAAPEVASLLRTDDVGRRQAAWDAVVALGPAGATAAAPVLRDIAKSGADAATRAWAGSCLRFLKLPGDAGR
jgi:HEAT repeat protein